MYEGVDVCFVKEYSTADHAHYTPSGRFCGAQTVGLIHIQKSNMVPMLLADSINILFVNAVSVEKNKVYTIVQ